MSASGDRTRQVTGDRTQRATGDQPRPLSYAVISPVRDEAAFLPLTASSLIGQSIRPRAWVIVDDGSRDDTAAIADRLAREHDWISAVHRPRRASRERGGPIVRAFADGLSRLDQRDDVIVKLDGDLQLPAHYFEWVLSAFARDPRAGIVGGTVYVHDGSGWIPDAVGRRTVHGAIKAYRRDCLDAIGGLHASMGWDGIDEYAARSRGWRVLPLTELTVLHYKPRGSKQRWTRARWEEGRGMRYMGYSWRGVAVRTAYRCIKERPPLLAGLLLAAGFGWATLTRMPRCPDEQAISCLRGEQRERFRRLLRGRDLEPDRLADGGPAFWALQQPQVGQGSAVSELSAVSEGSAVSEPAALPVSVVIPVHDRAALLERAVRSARTQTAPPAEIIVVDDGSSDDSAGVAAALGCVVVRHERNQGAAAARNTGVARARHEWIALLDSDDEWQPHHLATVWAARGEHQLVSSSALVLDPDGRPTQVIGPPFWRGRILTGPADLLYPENSVVASGALVRRATVQAVGGYDTTLRYSEDFDLWTRVLARGTGCSLPEVTVLMRAHAGRKSGHRDGPSRAQRTIAQRVQGVTGERVRVERRLGVRAWDDLRRALHERDGRRAAGAAGRLVRRPQRVAGVLGIWLWRRHMARRARAFARDGRPRIAVVSAPPGAALRPCGDTGMITDWRGPGVVADWHEPGVIEDWRGLGLLEVGRRALLAPPRAALASRRSHRLLLRFSGVPAAER